MNDITDPDCATASRFSSKIRMDVVNAFQSEIIRFIDREIYPQVSKLQAQIQQNNSAAKYVNRLGVLYARYGLIEESREQFQSIAGSGDYAPAMMNLGNLARMEEDSPTAKTWYKKALDVDPWNARVLASLSSLSYEMSDLDEAQEYYERLNDLNPSLAERFTYVLGTENTTRASRSGGSDNLLWNED